MISRSDNQIQNRNILKPRLIILILITCILSIGGFVYADTSDVAKPNAGYGWFKIESAPQNGEVIFDGQSYGSTPVLIMVREDTPPSHEVIIRMDGYEDYTQQIFYNPKNGETLPIILDATQTLNNIIGFLNEN